MAHLDIPAVQAEYSRLEKAGVRERYLDATGAALYPAQLIDAHGAFLNANVLGNPHSPHEASLRSTRYVEGARERLLDFWNGEDEYELVFTPNATGALKLFAEAFRWKDALLMLSEDNHNSVLGMREFARRGKGKFAYWEIDEQMCLREDQLDELLDQASKEGRRPVGAYPLESNFDGKIHPQQFVERIRSRSGVTVLDPAAFAPKHRLDLKAVRPDVACVSLYKILGYPTGVGALLIRKEVLKELKRPWFSGGTVDGVSHFQHVLSKGHDGFEDGTSNFLSIMAVPFILDFLEKIGGIEAVEQHVRELIALAITELKEIPNLTLYGVSNDPSEHGGTLAFNILDADDKPVHHSDVVTQASAQSTYFRSGCFCNPLAGARALGIPRQGPKGLEHLIRLLRSDQNCSDSRGTSRKKPGACRLSPGLHNTEDDVRYGAGVIRSIAADALKG